MRKQGLFSWVFGIIAGTLVGVLFAPKKGAELRQNIKKERKAGGLGVNSLTTAFKNLGKEISETAQDIYESDEVQEFVEKVKDKSYEGKEKINEKVSDLAERGAKKATKLKAKAKKIIKQQTEEKSAEKKTATKPKSSKKKDS